MDIKNITELYYSHWLGSNENLFRTDKEVTFIYTEERNKVQNGYGKKFDLWVLVTADKVFVSYGDAAKSNIGEMKAVLDKYRSTDDIADKIKSIFGVEPQRNIKYWLKQVNSCQTNAKILCSSDYPGYERFFIKNNPSCGDISWLKEYFEELLAEDLCCGVFANNELVSCTDSPTVPYMTDIVREIGINTLSEHRRKGYAEAACTLCMKEILKNGKCPIWSTSADNISSQILAERLGFEKIGDCCCI